MPPATLTPTATTADAQLADLTTRLLLLLLESDEPAVSKGTLKKRLKRKQEKKESFNPLFENVLTQLENEGAIAIFGKGNALKFAIAPPGINLLGQHLQNGDLIFDKKATIVGAWMAKALCKWVQQSPATTNGAADNGNGKASQEEAIATINSYDEFKPVALDLFERLNKGYNYGGLVPIWHMRRELGDRIDRLDFNDWVMKMQADKILYLQSGEAIGATDDQKEDSISSEIRGLLFYVSKPV